MGFAAITFFFCLSKIQLLKFYFLDALSQHPECPFETARQVWCITAFWLSGKTESNPDEPKLGILISFLQIRKKKV